MRDTDIWEGKTLTQLLAQIHYNTVDKRDILVEIINDLRTRITDNSEAQIFAPIIKDYIDVLVRSDDQLIKVATIVQRQLSAETQNGGDSPLAILSAEDMIKLQQEVRTELNQINEIHKELPSGVVTASSGSSGL